MTYKKIARTMLTAACLLLAVGLKAEDVKEYKTFIKNDMRVHYCTSNGVTVMVEPSGGDICKPTITIVNESGTDFTFNPSDIKVFTYAIPKQRDRWERHHVQLWFSSGNDPQQLERDPLTLYSFSGQSGTGSVDVGINSRGIVDELRRIRENMNTVSSVERMPYVETRSEREQKNLRSIYVGWWRSNTVFDGEALYGYISIKNDYNDQVILQIPVNGEMFEFFVEGWK